MKLLMLSRYGRLGASSRVRFFQYLPWLESVGISITSSPLFPDDYVQGLQRNYKSPVESVREYAGRLQALLSTQKFDLLWIEKETMPWLPVWRAGAQHVEVVPTVIDLERYPPSSTPNDASC